MTQHPELTLTTEHRPFQTQRRDAWWLQPLAVFLGLGTFIVYATFRVFQGDHFLHESYLSPFYSPLLFSVDGSHSWFWNNARLDAGFHNPRCPYFMGTPRISLYLLLLSGCVLQSILGRSTLLHSIRTAQRVSRRTLVSIDCPEYP